MIARIGRQMAGCAQLARIDASAMQYLGISRTDLDAECRKHFWQG